MKDILLPIKMITAGMYFSSTLRAGIYKVIGRVDKRNQIQERADVTLGQ